MMIHKLTDHSFVSNGNGGEESRIAERQREKVCLRDSKWRRGKDSVGHKTGRWRNTSGEINFGINL
jgi:hypothetical protein